MTYAQPGDPDLGTAVAASSGAVQVIDSLDAFLSLSQEWDDVVRPASADRLFLSQEWIAGCIRHLGGDLLALVARGPDGRARGVVPLFRSGDSGSSVLRLVGSEDVSDFLDVPLAPGEEAVAAGQIVGFLLGPSAPPWEMLDLEYLPSTSSAISFFPGASRARGLAVQVSLQEIAPAVPLPSSFQAFLGQLSASRRAGLVRKRRILGQGASWERVRAGEPEFGEALDAFLELMAASTEEKRRSLSEAAFRGFLSDVPRRLEGVAEVATLTVAGRRVAAVLQFVVGDRVMFYNSGRRPDAGGSPGIVLLTCCIDDAIQRGFRWFDLLRGEEPYKDRLGAEPRSLFRLRIQRRADSP